MEHLRTLAAAALQDGHRHEDDDDVGDGDGVKEEKEKEHHEDEGTRARNRDSSEVRGSRHSPAAQKRKRSRATEEDEGATPPARARPRRGGDGLAPSEQRHRRQGQHANAGMSEHSSPSPSSSLSPALYQLHASGLRLLAQAGPHALQRIQARVLPKPTAIDNLTNVNASKKVDRSRMQIQTHHLLSPVSSTSPAGSPSMGGTAARAASVRTGTKARASPDAQEEENTGERVAQTASLHNRPASAAPASTPRASAQVASSRVPLPVLVVNEAVSAHVVPTSTAELLAQTQVILADQVVYWGNSKSRFDVTARIVIPTRLQSSGIHDMRASCHLLPSAIEAEQYTNEVPDKKTALLVLKLKSDAVCEFEATFRQCINKQYARSYPMADSMRKERPPAVLPMVTYTHSKAITRACCRILWHPNSEKAIVSVENLMARLQAYHKYHLGWEMHESEKRYFQAKLSSQKNTISYEEFYTVLGEWFVLAIKLAKKKRQYLWQQGDKSFIPLLTNPTKDEPTILKEPGDFVVYIGEEMKAKKGSNSMPGLRYPLQITYRLPDGRLACMGVENKLDKLDGFIHEKKCLRHYLVMGCEGQWVRVPKEQFAFNAAQHRRWETSGGETCVVGQTNGQCMSYAHSS